MDPSTHIIGIGGLPRSGKDTLAEKFIESGYFGVSLGDIVRNVSRERHKDTPDPISVANMTETSNYLRTLEGSDFALKKALSLFYQSQQSGAEHRGLVVWSVRAPVEIDFILNYHGEVIWVEASDTVRYQRAMAHLREGEAMLTPEQFKAQEALQWQPQPGLAPDIQMDISYVKRMATKQFTNNFDSLQEFDQKATEFIKGLEAIWSLDQEQTHSELY